MSAGSQAAGRPIIDVHFPAGVLVVLVSRDRERVIPEGSTVLRAGDRLLLIADDGARTEVRRLFSGE